MIRRPRSTNIVVVTPLHLPPTAAPPSARPSVYHSSRLATVSTHSQPRPCHRLPSGISTSLSRLHRSPSLDAPLKPSVRVQGSNWSQKRRLSRRPLAPSAHNDTTGEPSRLRDQAPPSAVVRGAVRGAGGGATFLLLSAAVLTSIVLRRRRLRFAHRRALSPFALDFLRTFLAARLATLPFFPCLRRSVLLPHRPAISCFASLGVSPTPPRSFFSVSLPFDTPPPSLSGHTPSTSVRFPLEESGRSKPMA